MKERRSTNKVGLVGTGMVEAVLRDQHTVLTVASPLRGQHGMTDIAISLPTIVGRKGIEEVLNLPLSERELAAFQNSAQTLKDRLPQVG
jgi:L-lactate dehydrogenase